MTKIPTKIRKEIDLDPNSKYCALYGWHGHVCGGRLTCEHALIYAGKQIQEAWAIPVVCASAQEVDEFQDAHTMNKELNVWVALNRGTQEDFARFPRAFPTYLEQRERLNRKYGVWYPKYKVVQESEINYSLLDRRPEPSINY